jgi:hypothetical protein
VIKIAEVEGAPYMYNDFTGATLADQAQSVLFDFSTHGLAAGISNVRYEWIPKNGFSNVPVGLLVGVRCYTKGANPPPFTPITFANAFTTTNIPGCGGKSINQVEFQLGILPKTKFTRMQSLTVRASPF